MRQGWEIKKLGELFEIKPPKKKVRDRLKDTDMVTFLPMEDLGILSKNFNSSKERKIDDVYSSYTYFAENDLLLAKITPCFENGKIGIARNLKNGIGFGSSEFIVFRSKGKIIQDYLFYFLSRPAFREEGKRLMTGAVGHKRIPIEFINNYILPFPKALSEQQKVVSILDEAFEAIAKAKANAEQNLKNAKELFESVIGDIFQRSEDSIDRVPIASVCKEIFAGGDAPKENFSKVKNEKYSIPIIANAVKENGLYGYTDFSRVNEPSITISARGSGTGHTEIRYEPFFPIVRLIVLIPNIDRITLEFLKYSVQKLDILSNGSAIPQLTIPMINEYSIVLPSLTEQQTIVQKLDVVASKTKKLETIYQQKLDDLEELKKSILQKAFNGEL